MKVVQRKGARSYTVKDMYGNMHDCHLEDLKPYIAEHFPGTPEFLEHHLPLPSKKKLQPIAHIRDHRKVDNAFEFLVTWGDADPSESIWEKGHTFTHNGQLIPLWEYCRDHRIPLEVPHILPIVGRDH